MKVLLINPSNTMLEIMGGARVFVHKTEPLGLLYIAGVLEREGHEVSVIDAWAESISMDQVKERLRHGTWDLVGINTLTSSGRWVYELGGHIKRNHPEMKVVLGNIHASVYAGFYLEQGRCDYVVHGEAEMIMRDLARALDEGTPLADVAGLSYLRDDGAVQHTGPGQVVQDLDWLPLPARHLVDMSHYTGKDFVSRYQGSYRVLHATRGCPFACTFCVVNADRNYRMRSPELVVDEIDMLVNEHNACFIEFLDPLLTVSKPYIIDVCKRIVDRNIQFEWECEGHVNTVNDEVLHWMRRAGCRNVAYGIETAVPEIIKRVRKGSSLHRVHGAIEATHRAGINPHGLFILGFPGETREESEMTVKFALSLPLDFAQFAILVPYPGSDIYNDLVAEKKLDQEEDPEEKVANWKRYNAYLLDSEVEPIYVPEGRTVAELKNTQRAAIRRFYLRPRQAWKELKKFRPRNWRMYAEGIGAIFLPTLKRLLTRSVDHEAEFIDSSAPAHALHGANNGARPANGNGANGNGADNRIGNGGPARSTHLPVIGNGAATTPGDSSVGDSAASPTPARPTGPGV